MSMVLVDPVSSDSRVIRLVMEAGLAPAWAARVKRRYGEEVVIKATTLFFMDLGGALIMGEPEASVEMCGCTFSTLLSSVPYMRDLGRETTRTDWSQELGTPIVAVQLRHRSLILSLTHAKELLQKLQAEFDRREQELEAFYKSKGFSVVG